MLSALRRSVERSRSNSPGQKLGKDKKPWKASFHKLLICDNGKDNSPETFSRGDMPNDIIYYISQSRSPGHKDVGQDAMATATHGDWECNVLCDGHDRDGHLVARAVCMTLPHILLRRVHERIDPSTKVEASVIRKAFEECANIIAWTSEGVKTGMFVKVFGGPWKDKVGYVGDSKDASTSVVIIVDANGYHRPVIENKYLKRAKYTGGSTCICVVRNVKTGDCRIGFTGDSRALIVRCKHFDDPVLKPVFGLQTYDRNGKLTVPPMGITSPAHNVFSKDELVRLNTHHAGSFEIDGAFLVNPVTKFAIQPTRGFGDFDMFGTGYTNEPEISSSFKLEEGTFLMCASDGVFDEHVWKDDELVTFFESQIKTSKQTTAIAEMLYRETLDRSLAGGYVDDISFFMMVAPQTSAASGETPPMSQASSESLEGQRLSRKSLKGDGETDPSEESSARKSQSSAGSRKSLFGGLLRKKSKSKGSHASSKSEPVDEDVIATKPDIDRPNPEDRRKTIDRKERGSFTELSDLLKEEMTARGNGVESGSEADPEEIASLVLKRYASRYGHSLEDVDLGREVRTEAAREGARLSARLSRRQQLDEEDEE